MNGQILNCPQTANLVRENQCLNHCSLVGLTVSEGWSPQWWSESMVTGTAESSYLHLQAGGKEDTGNGVFASFEPSKPATVTYISHEGHTS